MEKMKQLIANLSKTKLIIIGIVAVLLISVLTFFALYSSNTSAVSSKSEVVAFEIVEGDTLDSVTSKLEERGIIKSASFGKLAGKMSGNTAFYTGVYALDKSWNTKKVLSYMTDPKNVMENEKMVTFKEGVWAMEIAKMLGDDKDFRVTADELLALWNDDAFLEKCISKYDFLDNSILNSNYRVKLEGYLFPETYSIAFDATAEEITYIFLDHFQTVYDDLKEEFKKSDMSIHDVITLASMVQYEASSEEDMKLVAGVFFNRMDEGMNLGSSVTVCYALYDQLDKSDPDSWKQCEAQYDIDSPYNTYLYTGLPVGPIENPGKKAIEAVLHPTDSEYLYFMADVYGDGKVYYAKTYEEHQKNTQKYLGY